MGSDRRSVYWEWQRTLRSDNFLYLENIRNGDRRYLNPQPLECNARRNKTYPLNAEEAATIVEEPWHGVEIDDDQAGKKYSWKNFFLIFQQCCCASAAEVHGRSFLRLVGI